MSPSIEVKAAVVIGGGPAGLMMAEQLSNAGIAVDVYDAMPSVGRKLLRAGVGGLNLTHSEDFPGFVSRYGDRAPIIEKWLQKFDASALRDWAADLGIETFIGSSGRVFPVQKKAAPLLRAWLQRLKEKGVNIHTRHRWQGWDQVGNLLFETAAENRLIQAQVTIFALGGASWSRFGSDGKWAPTFQEKRIECIAFEPSNCGFEYPWQQDFITQHAGNPLKGVALQLGSDSQWYKRGDAVISRYGIEGSLVYAASLQIRDEIKANGHCTIYWDLLPDKSLAQLEHALTKRKVKDSTANVLRKQLGISGTKLALLKSLTQKSQMQDLGHLPSLLKKLPQRLAQARPLDEAISTDGGISFSALDDDLMLRNMANVYCIGEMLDWESVTGGYLLTACYASAVQAATSIIAKEAAKQGIT